MYILLLLLLFTPATAADVTIEQLCKEMATEVLSNKKKGKDKQAGLEPMAAGHKTDRALISAFHVWCSVNEMALCSSSSLL